MDRILFSIGNQDEADILDWLINLFVLRISWKLKPCATTSYKLAGAGLFQKTLRGRKTAFMHNHELEARGRGGHYSFLICLVLDSIWFKFLNEGKALFKFSDASKFGCTSVPFSINLDILSIASINLFVLSGSTSL